VLRGVRELSEECKVELNVVGLEDVYDVDWTVLEGRVEGLEKGLVQNVLGG
jgi:hypothetical protein